MKRYIIHLSAILALLLAAAACTQDEGLNPTAATTTGTRATVDGDWKGVTAVAIQIGNEVKAYRVTPSADRLTATLSSDDPYYWTGTGLVTVSAWWPYTDGETAMPAVVVQADQSGDGYAQSDHIGVAGNFWATTKAHPRSTSRTAPPASASRCRAAHRMSAPCA